MVIMTKKEMIRLYSEENGVSLAQSERELNRVSEFFKFLMVSKKDFIVKGVFSFVTKELGERIRKNPKTGVSVTLGKSVKGRLKISPTVNYELNR
jgi:nucleoid DNA-binding protein